MPQSKAWIPAMLINGPLKQLAAPLSPPGELFTLILSLVAWLDKDENPQHRVLKETEEAHKPIYRVSLDQFSSFEAY